MKREQSNGAFLSAVFVDYDNIYLSLKRKNEEAAKRFAKDASVWVKAIETGSLITPTNGPTSDGYRRIVMNRCYGNPVPRRNQSDNSTDMNSFPFTRHHFLRAGFEIIDCPPLTAQLKNSSDIRMVMDVRDYLTHATYFDEFVILSGDADFTPVLHRLRAHARRTVIYANDHTAAPYTAISDGEIREQDLISLLLEGKVGAEGGAAEIAAKIEAVSPDAARREIMADVVSAVRGATAPMPLEALADRAVRHVGYDKTIGTGWGGAGGFRELLASDLPEGLKLSGEPPYVVIDASRHLIAHPAPIQVQATPVPAPQVAALAPIQKPVAPPAQMQAKPQPQAQAMVQPPVAQQPHYQQLGYAEDHGFDRVHAPAVSHNASAPHPMQMLAPAQPRESFAPRATAPSYPAPSAPTARVAAQQNFPAPSQPAPAPRQSAGDQSAPAPMAQHHQQQPVQYAPQQPAQAQQAPEAASSMIHQSIARIHEACQAPPLAPPEYRMLFEVMAQEINENGLIGAQTIANIGQRAQERGIEIRRDDVRFVLEVVSEADPWFEQGASANLFAGRFRNFVVARCRGQGLNLSADELDLVEAWFAGNAVAPQPQPQVQIQAPAPAQRPATPPVADSRQQSWASLEDGRKHVAEQRHAQSADVGADDFPRIVRTRLRG